MDKHTEAGQPSNYWLSQLESAKKREATWIKQAQSVVDLYRDERDANGTEKRVNLLWSNTEVLKSALFSHLGKPDVRRRFSKPGLDEKVAKTAAIVL